MLWDESEHLLPSRLLSLFCKYITNSLDEFSFYC